MKSQRVGHVTPTQSQKLLPSVSAAETPDHRGAGRRTWLFYPVASLPATNSKGQCFSVQWFQKNKDQELNNCYSWKVDYEIENTYFLSLKMPVEKMLHEWVITLVAAEAQEADPPLIGRSVVWLPCSSGPRVDVSSNWILNPESLPMAVCHQCVNVCGCLASSDGLVGTLCGSPHHQGVSGWMWSVVWNALSGQQTRKRLFKCSTFNINMSKNWTIFHAW